MGYVVNLREDYAFLKCAPLTTVCECLINSGLQGLEWIARGLSTLGLTLS